MLLCLTKRAFLQDQKFWKEEGTLFLIKVIFTKLCFINLALKISQELLQNTLNFILKFFHLELYHKNQIHGSHHEPSKMFHKGAIILTFYICIWKLSLV